MVHGSIFVSSTPDQWWVSLDILPNIMQTKLARVANYVKSKDLVNDVYVALRKSFLSNDLVSETYCRDFQVAELSIIDDLMTSRYITDEWRKDGKLEGTTCATDIRDD